jgi:glycosyltransferase involved in cell wall biosynthesis
MDITIIIPTFNRQKLLEKSLMSILAQKTTLKYEVIIVLNGEDEETKLFLEGLTHKYKQFTYQTVLQCTPSEARNYAIKKATGRYLYFIDDDAYIRDEHLETLRKIINGNKIAIIGGPDQTPIDANNTAQAIGIAIQSRFCTGQTFKRHTLLSSRLHKADETYLTLANLIIDREFFLKHNLYFSKKFFRNEENFLILQAEMFTDNIFYHPDLYIYHYRRDNLLAGLKAFYSSGYYRNTLLSELKSKQQLAFLLPLLSVIAQIYLSIFFFQVAFKLALLYILISLVISIKLTLQNSKTHLTLYVLILLYLIPTAYGLGLLVNNAIRINPWSNK